MASFVSISIALRLGQQNQRAEVVVGDRTYATW